MAIDFGTLVLSWRPNQFLVLPPGFTSVAKPHAASPVFAAKPDAVLAALKQVALAEPRTSVRADDPGAHEIVFVQRSRIFGFPDVITAQVKPVAGGTGLAVLSRAKYGIRDFGVNRARVERWLEKLRGRLPAAGA